MTEKKKPIAELRKELKHLLVDISVRPSAMKNRGDIEQLIGAYSKLVEEKKALPPGVRGVGGRKKPMEVEAEEDGEGIAVPKKLHKEKTIYAAEKEKKAKKPAAAAKVEEDSGTGSESEAEERKAKVSTKKVEKAAVAPTEKPKRVITPEHLAKMKAGRLAKKSDASGEPKPAEPKPAEPKKETPPPDAPGYNKLPVRKLD